MIGKGLLKVDDYIRFGKFVDRLSKYCHTIQYIPKKNLIVICFPKTHLDTIRKEFGDIEIIVPKRGPIAFARIKWG